LQSRPIRCPDRSYSEKAVSLSRPVMTGSMASFFWAKNFLGLKFLNAPAYRRLIGMGFQVNWVLKSPKNMALYPIAS
jgi:hypothetical protein